MFRRKKKRKLLSEDEITDKFKDVELEKNDAFAMALAAVMVFLPFVLVIALIIIAFVWIVF